MEEKIEELRLLFLNCEKMSSIEGSAVEKCFGNIIQDLISLRREEFRIAHVKLSSLLHDFDSVSLSFLVNFIFHHVKEIEAPKEIKPSISVKSRMNNEEFINVVKKCMENQNSNEVRVLEYEIPDISPFKGMDVLPHLRSALNDCIQSPIESEQLKENMAVVANLLGMSRKFSSSEQDLEKTYIQFEGVLQRINRDENFQLARDFSEEAMICAMEDGVPQLGHFCRFTLYVKQTNPIDAGLNGCLLAATLPSSNSMSRLFYVHLLLAVFLFYRTIGKVEFATSIYEKLVDFPGIEEYEHQSATLAFFNMLLLIEDENVFEFSDEYVGVEFDAIKSFGTASLIPWYVMLCNLNSRYPRKYENSSSLKELAAHIKSVVPSKHLETYEGQIFKKRPNTKDLLRSGLEQLTRSRNIKDHVYESNLLQIRASRVIENSIESGDLEGILLAHLAKSDGSIAFDLAEHIPRYELLRFDQESMNKKSGRFDDYLEKTKSKLSKHMDCRYVWLGFDSEKAYFLIFENGIFLASGYIPGCTKSSMRKWLLNKLPEIGFNDSPPSQGPFVSREDIWKKEGNYIRENVPKIFVPFSDKSTILLTDVEMACFPHNFIFDTFSAEPQKICAPLSLDHYLGYIHKKIDISRINIWAPTIEEDYAILLAFSRLKECIEHRNPEISEDLFPKFSSEGDVNMFICHGGRNQTGGFTGLYPSSNKKYTSTGVLGMGKVAVLFVCHSGHIASDYYARSFQTLSKTLLLSGYEAVIASAWSLNINIPGPWADRFLASMQEGLNIVEAVKMANLRIKELYPVESAWAAMHLFGNPHITNT